MAGGKGWGTKKDPLTQSEEIAGQDRTPPDIDTGSAGKYPEAVSGNIEAEKALDELRAKEDSAPSCMNGCPHFFPTPKAGGKYMGLCRRYPPVPSGNARFFTWPVVINHPVSGFPQYPICGEHPIFQQEQATGHKSPINFDLSTGQ